MLEFWTQPWFGWAIAIVIGLPIALIALTELGNWLARRNSPAAKPVQLLRTLVLPIGAVLVLLALVGDQHVEVTWVRITATVFGFLVILLLLSGINAVVFGRAAPESWRSRMPSIFVDLIRLALIVVGLALLLSWVWDADVGGLFAALGVTSIVIGLALQNAFGSVISGLLLLFEQPFRIGDWLDTAEGRGRVVTVNWRAVHLELPEGTRVIPTAQLADGSFTNLSRPTDQHLVAVALSFGADDAPHAIVDVLGRVAGDLPMLEQSRRPTVALTGPGEYLVEIPVASPADEDGARSLFLAWLWYAAGRAGLHWSGGGSSRDSSDAAVETAARALRVPVSDLAGVTVEHYAAGEPIVRESVVPDAVRVLRSGAVSLSVGPERSALGTAGAGEVLGQGALTREAAPSSAIALVPTEVVVVPTATVERLARQHPAVGTDLGSAIDAAKRAARERPVG